MSKSKKPFKSYTDSQEESRNFLRQNLIDVADHLMTTEGIEAMTVRRIATELEASTKVIYSLFGGKDGLANELYLEGSIRLRKSMDAVSVGDDAKAYITASCWAYWDFAQSNPSYYELMFGNAISTFQPNEENVQRLIMAFANFEKAFADYASQQQLKVDDFVETIHFIWATMHGVISLQHAGLFTEEQARQRFQHSINAILLYVTMPE